MGGKKAKQAGKTAKAAAEEESCAEEEDGVESGDVRERFMKRHIPTSSPFDPALAAGMSIAFSN